MCFVTETYGSAEAGNPVKVECGPVSELFRLVGIDLPAPARVERRKTVGPPIGWSDLNRLD